MKTYSEIKAQIAKLEQEAQALKQSEVRAAIEQIQGLMQTYGLTVSDLQAKTKNRASKGTAVAAKYRDPESGATWTGRGRAPRWLNGRDKDQFLIK